MLDPDAHSDPNPVAAPHLKPKPQARPRRRLPSIACWCFRGAARSGPTKRECAEALQASGVDPDWVAGISIGAINAALIAGNPPERRLERMRSFWDQASSGPFFSPMSINFNPFRSLVNQMSAATIATFGAPGFFAPRLPGSLLWPQGSHEAISYYDTAPLRGTLERLVDFERINSGATRLSVGAVNVQTGNSVVFDSAHQKIGPEHIMASGALPPGFPPVWIEGEAYWDGGLVSNTPLQFVLDDQQDQDLLIFQVDLFNAHGPMPRNMLEVDEREKDIRYSSRTRLNTDASLRIPQGEVGAPRAAGQPAGRASRRSGTRHPARDRQGERGHGGAADLPQAAVRGRLQGLRVLPPDHDGALGQRHGRCAARAGPPR